MKFDDVVALLHDQLGVVACVPDGSDDTPSVYLVPPVMKPLPLEHIPVVIRIKRTELIKHVTIMVRPIIHIQLDINKLGRLNSETFMALNALAEREVAHHIHVRSEVAFHLGVALK